jgi:hypothetical protein
MIQSLDFALGFFVTVIFLASVVVVLTLIYVSHPKLGTQTAKGEKGTKKIPSLKKENLSGARGDKARTGALESAGDHSPEKLSKKEKKSDIPVQGKETSEKTPALPAPSVSELVTDKKIEAKKEEPNSVSRENEKSPLTQPEAPKKTPPPDMTSGIEKPPASQNQPVSANPLAATTDVSVIKSFTAPSGPPVGAKPKLEAQLVQSVQSMKPETAVNPVSPSVPMASDNETKKATEEKLQTDPVQDSRSDGDFSDLFAEEMEENEASRLAKELGDIDTENILQTSQSLISQIRRKKKAFVAND